VNDWGEAAYWVLVGALLALLAYGGGQMLVIWASGGV
jgi:hypothetical protein